MSFAPDLLFEPGTVCTQISATTTSARTALEAAPTGEGLTNESRRIVEIGTETSQADVFIKFGDSSVTATLNGGPIIPGGTVRGFTVPKGATHVAAITRSGTATVNVICGRGF